MKFKIVRYQDLQAAEWDKWVERLDSATYFHSRALLDYMNHFAVTENLSFLCFENEDQLLAACPLGVSIDSKTQTPELSFAGSPLGAPAVAKLAPALRHQVLDEIFRIYASEAKRFNAKRIRLITHPVRRADFESGVNSSENAFELLRYPLLPSVTNSVVVDLGRSLVDLEAELSKDHRRHIRRAGKFQIRVDAFDQLRNADRLELEFERFQKAHFKSAGRMTRPQGTWDAMRDGVREGHASLFVAYVEQAPASYLYCGEFGRLAWSWSQVNIDEFEKEYAPRHFLEWTAILHYRLRHFRFYELGERFSGSSWMTHPTSKEITISDFKARYGGTLLQHTHWVGYFDKEALRLDIEADAARLIDSLPVGLEYPATSS